MVETIMSRMSDPRVRMALTFLAVLVALAVLGSCESGGMYQGGGDSEPHWR